MRIEFDPAKRDAILEKRGLDMAWAADGAGRHIPSADIRFDRGENRFLTFGLLDDRLIVLAWTPRGTATRIISMRKANEREERRYRRRLG